MSFLSNINLDAPLALYSIPVAFFVGLAPHVQKLLVLQGSGIKVDNKAPRSTIHVAEKKGIPAATLAKYHRLDAAHTNANENFPIFVSAIFAGLVGGLPARQLNTFAGVYLGCRLVYNFSYANQTTEALAGLRSLSFWTATFYAFYIMISAGNLMVKNASL